MTNFVFLRCAKAIACKSCGALMARTGAGLPACDGKGAPIPILTGDAGGHVFDLTYECGSTAQLHQGEEINYEHGPGSIPGPFKRAVLVQ